MILKPNVKVGMAIIALLMPLAQVVADEAQPAFDIRRLMTEEELKQSGLEKLSPEELQALNRWLIDYTANEAVVVKKRSEEVKKAAKADIHSRIVGSFSGWSGDTYFKLENGQIWQQRTPGKWRTRLQDPEVVIETNRVGFRQLRVLSANKMIGVKRVR